MKTYRKTAVQQGLPVTTANLPALRALPQVFILPYSPAAENEFRDSSETANDMVIFVWNDVPSDDAYARVHSFLVHSWNGIREGEAGDYLMVNNMGERHIFDADKIRAHYQEVVFGEGEYVPVTSGPGQLWSLADWLKAKEKEVGEAGTGWPTGEAVKKAALAMLKLVREHVEQVATGFASSAVAPNQLKDTAREPFGLFQHNILGHIARWAVDLSPYPVPDNFEQVLTAFAASTAHLFDASSYRQVTRQEVDALLDEHLFVQPAVQAWNQRRNGNTAEFQFVSSSDGPGDPDDNFIDLDALRQNILRSLEQEEESFQRANDEFEGSWAREVGQARAYLGEVLEWVRGKQEAPGEYKADGTALMHQQLGAYQALSEVVEHITQVMDGIDKERSAQGYTVADANEVIDLPTKPEEWRELAHGMMLLIMLDNGAINRLEPAPAIDQVPQQHLQAIADTAQVYFTAHPELLTPFNIDQICTGSEDEEELQQLMLPEYEALSGALNAFFNQE